MKKIILIMLVCFFSFPYLVFALVNINTASVKELDEGITGVGNTIAQNIINYRNDNGPFKKIEDLVNVSGIGEKNFLGMKDQITVGSGSAGEVVDNDGEDNDSSGISDERGGEVSSVNTNQSAPATYSQESFKIGAGRERLATVRTPILFLASQNKKGKETNDFTWSFGDGTSASGQKIYHTYQFPGRYNIVLNGSIDKNEEAVARTTVVVIEPKIKITAIDLNLGYVEITNSSDKEQNLNGWILSSKPKRYVFPLDTIISPQSSIKVPLGFIGLDDRNIKEITLSYPDGGVVSGASLQTGVDLQKVAEIKKQLVKAKKELAAQNVSINMSDVKQTSAEGKSVVILKQSPSWFEKIKNAIFK